MNIMKLFYGISVFILFLVLFVLFFIPISLDFTNSDLGRHLLLGKIIVTLGYVPQVNLLSFAYPNYPFINTHWLSEIVFYLWQSVFGFNGLVILSVLLASLAFTVIFVMSAKIDLFAAVLVSLVYLQVLSERTQIRPELFSFLFLSVFIIILYKYKEKYTKFIFILIPLELIWVNTHIYFFNGIVVLLLFLIDDFLSRKNTLASKKFLTLVFVTATASLATFINPNFIKGAFYPILVLNNYAAPVWENVSFFSDAGKFSRPSAIFFQTSVAILWISLFLERKKMNRIDFLLSTLFTVIGLFAIRNFPLFVFGTFIPCVKAVSYLVRNVFRKYSQKELSIKIVTFMIVFVSVTPSIKWSIETHGLGFGVLDNTANAIDFIKNNNIKGPIFNNYDIGNYLEYRLYPQEKVYVDNRPEAYPKEFFQKVYFPMQRSPVIFDQESKRYNFNIIFLAHEDMQGTYQLLRRLAREKEWGMIYLNSSIVIFTRNTPANQKIIKKYSIDQKNIKNQKLVIKNKDELENLINFFRAVGWLGPFLDMNMRYLDFDPENCTALKNIASIYQNYKKEDRLTTSIYANKYLQFCR